MVKTSLTLSTFPPSHIPSPIENTDADGNRIFSDLDIAQLWLHGALISGLEINSVTTQYETWRGMLVRVCSYETKIVTDLRKKACPFYSLEIQSKISRPMQINIAA